MGKGGSDKVEESFGGLEGVGPWCKEHGGAVYIGAGREVFWADFAEYLCVGVGGNQYGEATVIAAAGGGTDAFGYF